MDDITVSPEMIHAGVVEFERLSGTADSSYLVEAVYIAMVNLRQEEKHQTLDHLAKASSQNDH